MDSVAGLSASKTRQVWTTGRLRSEMRVMQSKAELGPFLASLQRTHEVLPFLEKQLPSAEVEWHRMPDAMVDVLTSSPDFRPPERGGPPVWRQLEGEGGSDAVVIVACPNADGEFWVNSPRQS